MFTSAPHLEIMALFGIRSLSSVSMATLMEECAEPIKQYIRVPVESIQSCIEQLGVHTSDDVPSGLVEDVSFRIRQIADVSGATPSHYHTHALLVS